MNFSVATSIQPQLPFTQVSALYQKALAQIEFPPNAVVEPRLAVTDALANVDQAIELLAPYAGSTTDPFVGRAATASITAAKMGVAALTSALVALDNPPEPGSTFITPFEKSVAMAKHAITGADNALWQE